MDPFTIYGAASTGVGLLGSLNSAFNRGGPQSEQDFNVDPEDFSMNRAKELLNPRSRPNMFALSRFGKLARDSAPTADTLFSFARGQGIGTVGAGALSYRQNEANMSKGREVAMGGYMDFLMGQERNAQGWAGQSFENRRFAKGAAAGIAGENQATQASFFDETAKMGMGFLGYGMQKGQSRGDQDYNKLLENQKKLNQMRY